MTATPPPAAIVDTDIAATQLHHRATPPDVPAIVHRYTLQYPGRALLRFDHVEGGLYDTLVSVYVDCLGASEDRLRRRRPRPARRPALAGHHPRAPSSRHHAVHPHHRLGRTGHVGAYRLRLTEIPQGPKPSRGDQQLQYAQRHAERQPDLHGQSLAGTNVGTLIPQLWRRAAPTKPSSSTARHHLGGRHHSGRGPGTMVHNIIARQHEHVRHQRARLPELPHRPRRHRAAHRRGRQRRATCSLAVDGAAGGTSGLPGRHHRRACRCSAASAAPCAPSDPDARCQSKSACAPNGNVCVPTLLDERFAAGDFGAMVTVQDNGGSGSWIVCGTPAAATSTTPPAAALASLSRASSTASGQNMSDILVQLVHTTPARMTSVFVEFDHTYDNSTNLPQRRWRASASPSDGGMTWIPRPDLEHRLLPHPRGDRAVERRRRPTISTSASSFSDGDNCVSGSWNIDDIKVYGY